MNFSFSHSYYWTFGGYLTLRILWDTETGFSRSGNVFIYSVKIPTIHGSVYQGHVTPILGDYLSSEILFWRKAWMSRRKTPSEQSKIQVPTLVHDVIQQQKNPQKQRHKEETLSPKRILSFHVLHLVCSHWPWCGRGWVQPRDSTFALIGRSLFNHLERVQTSQSLRTAILAIDFHALQNCRGGSLAGSAPIQFKNTSIVSDWKASSNEPVASYNFSWSSNDLLCEEHAFRATEDTNEALASLINFCFQMISEITSANVTSLLHFSICASHNAKGYRKGSWTLGGCLSSRNFSLLPSF